MPVILIVEDDPFVRELATLIFQDANFDVVEAKNAQEAVATLRTLGSKLDALFSDIQMPGSMDGYGLAFHARRDWPRLGIVLASGGVGLHTRELPEGCRFMRKPYTAISIVECVRGVITGCE